MKKIIFLLLLSPAFLWAQLSTKLELNDVFNLEYVSDPQISPDGQTIVYVRNFKDIMTDQNLSNLWMVNFDGSNHRPLTTGNQNDNSPRWSPDGKQLVYKSNKSEKSQLYLRWMDTGMETRLTNTTSTPGSVSWSPDGKHLAFGMFVPEKPNSIIKMPEKPKGAKWNTPPIYIDDLKYRADGQGYIKPGHVQLFVLSVDGGTPRQLTDVPHHHGSPQWTNDGKQLIFSANLHDDAEYNPSNSEVYMLNLSDGKVTALTDRMGPDGSPKISPDGKRIAYTGYVDQYLGFQQPQLSVMNTDGSRSKLISEKFDREIGNVQWVGDDLYFQYDSEGNTRIAKMGMNGKVTELVRGAGGLSLGRPYNAATYSVSDEGRIAYTYGGNQSPADLGVFENGETRRLTNLNEDLFTYKKPGAVEEIWFNSSFDDRKIQGWIVKPPDFDPNKKYPFILEIHGGPFASYGDVFSAEIQLYAAAGYVVLYTNPRGSSGYGADFGNLIHHNYPSQDYDDLMSGVDAVIAKGYVDENNLFVTGGSGGGVLSSWIIGKTDRFAAAVVAKPVINWYSFVLYADNPAFFAKYWFGKNPWEDPEAYMKRSPLSLVGNVNTPTMLLTGESDYRTPIAESEQYYAALKMRKVDAAMVRIPGAGHGIANRPSNLVGKVAAVLAWFEKYRD